MRARDCIDPDQWIADGKNLMDFVWPANERECQLVYQVASAVKGEEYAAHFAAHMGRFLGRIGELGGSDQKALIRDRLTEEQLRAAWNETR
jgi:hypothetical protein